MARVKRDEVFEAALDFLTNGAELPSDLRAQKRFEFTAAALRQIYDVANTNKKLGVSRDKKITRNTAGIAALFVGFMLFIAVQWPQLAAILRALPVP